MLVGIPVVITILSAFVLTLSDRMSEDDEKLLTTLVFTNFGKFHLPLNPARPLAFTFIGTVRVTSDSVRTLWLIVTFGVLLLLVANW